MILVFLFTACSNNEEQTKEADSATDITVANEKIGFSILKDTKPDEKGNIFISPTSALLTMLIVYSGTEGATKDEIAKALYINGFSTEQIDQLTKELIDCLEKDQATLQVSLANSLWLHENFSFKKDFKERMENFYHVKIANINPEDEQAIKQINKWVKEKTKGKIEDIVDQPLPSDLLTFIINAHYFHGSWKYEFNEDDTQEDDFFITEEESVKVPFMSLTKELTYFETDYFQAVKLPYSNGNMSMQIFLPKESETVDSLVEDMTSETWRKWQQQFNTKVEGTIRLPKFKLEYETNLKELLIKYGIQKLFIPGQANFSPMVEGTPSLHLDEVIQKTAIDIDEKGTEAVATTNATIKMTSASLTDDNFFVMNINRPFFFAIYDEELEHALFLGIINHPIV